MSAIAAAIERSRWTGCPPIVEDEDGLYRGLTEAEVTAGLAELGRQS